MELSHVISETVLATTGFLTFYVYLRKLNAIDSILWGTFILCVAIAALCAALRFAGFDEMILLNLYFKQFAASAGVLYLVLGVYSLVANVQLSKKVVYGALSLGFISSVVFIIFNFQKIIDIIPTVGIPIVCLLGIWAISKRRLKIGFYLLLGTFFSILANFIQLLDLPFNQIDTYCFLLASALFCFGLAGNKTHAKSPKYYEL
jgi:hypothetical protein